MRQAMRIAIAGACLWRNQCVPQIRSIYCAHSLVYYQRQMLIGDTNTRETCIRTHCTCADHKPPLPCLGRRYCCFTRCGLRCMAYTKQIKWLQYFVRNGSGLWRAARAASQACHYCLLQACGTGVILYGAVHREGRGLTPYALIERDVLPYYIQKAYQLDLPYVAWLVQNQRILNENRSLSTTQRWSE
jgi:hypothetical protein